AVEESRKYDVTALREVRVRRQRRPERRERSGGDIGRLDHGMRIAHRHGAELDLAAADSDAMNVRVAADAQGDLDRGEARRAHVDAHASVGEELDGHRAGRAFEAYGARAERPVAAQPGRDATHTVAALQGRAAVRVVYSVAKCTSGIARGVDRQQLIETHAEAAVADARDRSRIEAERPFAAIDHDEIVADPVHLREVQVHRGERGAFIARGRNLPQRSGRESSQAAWATMRPARVWASASTRISSSSWSADRASRADPCCRSRRRRRRARARAGRRIGGAWAFHRLDCPQYSRAARLPAATAARAARRAREAGRIP